MYHTYFARTFVKIGRPPPNAAAAAEYFDTPPYKSNRRAAADQDRYERRRQLCPGRRSPLVESMFTHNCPPPRVHRYGLRNASHG